jgi:putative cofactor-binding repeat protein
MRAQRIALSLACLSLACLSLAWTAEASAAAVSNTGELIDALRRAKPGETIALAPGEYDLKLNDFHGEVTITSADPSHRAILTGLAIKGSSGLTLSDLELVAPLGTGAPGWPNTFNIVASSHMTLDHLDVHSAPGGSLATQNGGLLVRDSDHVDVSNSDFHDLHHGIAHYQDDFLVIRGNHLHHLRDDGIHGGGSSNVLIEKNHCDSNRPDTDDPDHPDCIQFWTANTSAAAHDITIRNNTYDRGEGHPEQGIFLRDEGGKLPYDRVTITGNTIRGALGNGIYVNGANHLVVQDNMVCGYPDQMSWIIALGVQDVTVERNRATGYQYKNDGRVREDHNGALPRCRPQPSGTRGPDASGTGGARETG